MVILGRFVARMASFRPFAAMFYTFLGHLVRILGPQHRVRLLQLRGEGVHHVAVVPQALPHGLLKAPRPCEVGFLGRLGLRPGLRGLRDLKGGPKRSSKHGTSMERKSVKKFRMPKPPHNSLERP